MWQSIQSRWSTVGRLVTAPRRPTWYNRHLIFVLRRESGCGGYSRGSWFPPLPPRSFSRVLRARVRWRYSRGIRRSPRSQLHVPLLSSWLRDGDAGAIPVGFDSLPFQGVPLPLCFGLGYGGAIPAGFGASPSLGSHTSPLPFPPFFPSNLCTCCC